MKKNITYVLLIILVGTGIYLGLRFAPELSTTKQDCGKTKMEVDSIDCNIEKVLDLVGKQKIVKDQIRLVDSISKNKRHISLVASLEDSTKNVYLVKVSEDNGTNFVTYFNFMVDAKTMTIINPSGKTE